MNNYADIKYSKELAWLFSDAEWWWSIDTHANKSCIKNSRFKETASRFKNWTFYPAITTDMVLEVLPWNIPHENNLYQLIIQKNPEDLAVYYRCYTEGMESCLMDTIGKSKSESLPNTLCKMIQYLVKENIIKKKD